MCQSICPELEFHLKNDIEVPQRELTIGQPIYGHDIAWPPSSCLTMKEREIFTLLSRGMTRDDVCHIMNITKENLRRHIANGNKKYRESSRF
jgi:DNA-binding CsgD family transcriptional regulator